MDRILRLLWLLRLLGLRLPFLPQLLLFLLSNFLLRISSLKSTKYQDCVNVFQHFSLTLCFSYSNFIHPPWQNSSEHSSHDCSSVGIFPNHQPPPRYKPYPEQSGLQSPLPDVLSVRIFLIISQINLLLRLPGEVPVLVQSQQPANIYFKFSIS